MTQPIEGFQPETITFDVKGLFADGTTLKAEYGQSSATVESGQVTLNLPARDGVILAV